MDGKSSPTKFVLVLAFLLYASAFQVMANEEVKSTELNILQLPVSKDFIKRKGQVVATRYGPLNICWHVRCCSTDNDCVDAECGPKCKPDGFTCWHRICTT